MPKPIQPNKYKNIQVFSIPSLKILQYKRVENKFCLYPPMILFFSHLKQKTKHNKKPWLLDPKKI